MGYLICQHKWGRDMESDDFIRTTGFPHLDGQKVDFLLDSERLAPGCKVEDIPVDAYRWTGKKMYAELVSNINPMLTCGQERKIA